MSSIDVPLKSGRFPTAKFGQTQRKDKWWVEPLLVFLGYALFIVYANYAIIHYTCGDRPCFEVPGTGYLSPMFSPLLTRTAPAWWPSFFPFFGTALILWAPLGFRFTCYYYRGAYYKAWWAASLFSVHRDHLGLHSVLRRVEGALVRWPEWSG